MSVPVLASALFVDDGGGGRRPYWRVDEKVSHTSLSSSLRLETKGDHLGNELVSAVVVLSAIPGPLALASMTGFAPPLEIEVRKMVAVASVSASHETSGAAPAVGVPAVQVDSS